MVTKYIPELIRILFFFQIIGIESEFFIVESLVTDGQITWDQEKEINNKNVHPAFPYGSSYGYQRRSLCLSG